MFAEKVKKLREQKGLSQDWQIQIFFSYTALSSTWKINDPYLTGMFKYWGSRQKWNSLKPQDFRLNLGENVKDWSTFLIEWFEAHKMSGRKPICGKSEMESPLRAAIHTP